jgi:hypothetical protein
VDFLETAKLYSEHAGKSDIDLADVQLAIQSKVNSEFCGPPTREVRLLKSPRMGVVLVNGFSMAMTSF